MIGIGFRVGLLSLALIASQIVYMQALATAQWSHFAYMIISVALLGFGVSGTLLSLFPHGIQKRADTVSFLSTQLCAFSLLLALPLTMSEAFRFDMMKLFLEERQTARLIVSYGCFFLPFFWGALAIGLTFVIHPRKSGWLYGCNLAGSALGGPAAILLLSVTPSSRSAMILAFAVAIIGLLQAKTPLQKMGSIPALILGLFFILAPPTIHLSEYKDLARTMDLPEVRVTDPIPSAMGEVRRAQAPSLRFAPALSLTFTGQPPIGEALYVNGNYYGTLLPAESIGDQADSHILDYTPRGIAYALREAGKVLILGAGAGENVSHAEKRGAREIHAIEPNTVVRRLAQAHLEQSTTNRKENPIHWHGTSPRSWLEDHKVRRSSQGYDLIVLPEVGQFGGDAGLRATEEHFLMTREAFQSMWHVLSDKGILGVSVWLDYPPRDSLRVATLLTDLLENNGISAVESHLLILRNWGMVTFLLSKNPWSGEEIQSARQHARQQGFDLLIPIAENPEKQLLHTFEDDTLGELLTEIVLGDRRPVIQGYLFDLSVPTDSKPYFRHYLKWSELSNYRDLFMDTAAPFLEVGFPVLLLTFLQIALISLPMVILPLFKMRKISHGFLRTFFYFTGVGCGFMLWQIALIQKYTLYWGHPLFATAGVISVLLLGMGAGSYCSSRIKDEKRRSGQVTGLLALLLLVYAFFLLPFLTLTLGWEHHWRILIGTLVLLPPAFLMGLPFPLGIRLVEDDSRARIGWAWGLDGYASVISATGAALLSLQFGLTVPLYLAAIGYLAASLAIWMPGLWGSGYTKHPC